ncbi:MAG: phytanoyl-CoA dioxygenase [Rhodospirillaceae bacterium]|nr:phytanoyl-CoA dioxygenase [Rhodospirillaceae bacterium]
MSLAASTPPVDYGEQEEQMRVYLRDGEDRAMSLGNRGPIRYTEDGSVHPTILAAYWRYGFYVFENVVSRTELIEIEADLKDILDRLPTERGSPVDASGRPALGVDCCAPTLFWSKPLGDPFGGTKLANGRHPVKMHEPVAAADAPNEVVYLILGSLQFSEACLRLYGHPDILRLAAAINGDDFVPFTDALFIKEPGRGASVAWHQDGVTHWDSPDWDQGVHGVNFMTQLYGSTAANGVWVVPGTHKLGKVDIRARVREAGTERLPDAIPVIAKPGDLAITNRQVLHGSFANTSPDLRVTVNNGFHRRSSVLGVEGGGLHAVAAVFDSDRIRERSRVLGYAIHARRQRFPDEDSYDYEPFRSSGEIHRWDAAAKASMHDYNLLDLSI